MHQTKVPKNLLPILQSMDFCFFRSCRLASSDCRRTCANKSSVRNLLDTHVKHISQHLCFIFTGEDATETLRILLILITLHLAMTLMDTVVRAFYSMCKPKKRNVERFNKWTMTMDEDDANRIQHIAAASILNVQDEGRGAVHGGKGGGGGEGLELKAKAEISTVDQRVVFKKK